MVAPPEGGEPLPAAAEGLHHEEEQAAAEAQQALAAQLQPEAPPRASSSAEASRHMYEGEGRSFDEVAAARGIKPSTAVDHLLACAAAGTFASFTRLAAELQLGLPGSAWLSAAEVAEAVADVEQQQPGTPLSRLPLRAIRERLQAGTATGPKLAALEAQRGGDPVLVYGAIKLVLTALQHGVDFALISPPQPAAPPAPF